MTKRQGVLMTREALAAKVDRLAWEGVDDTTPPGHFLVAAVVLGETRTYLLAGKVGDPTAPVLGRVDSDGRTRTGYIGGRLLGGSWFPVTDSAAGFAHIAQHSASQ
jgi:hypothetical protein